MKRKKLIGIGRTILRNKIIRKVGLDTDNCFSWIENEKLTWNYKPRIAKRGNLLHVNYVVFSELMNLLSQKYPDKNINPKNVFNFLKRNRIKPIKKKDVDLIKFEEIFNKLKIESKNNKWSSGENDLKIISVYYVAGIDCISTNNIKDFQKPCDYLGIPLDFPPIIQPGSRQDVNRMLRDLYKNYPFRKNRKH